MAGYAELTLVRGMGYLANSQAAIAHNLANVDTAAFKRRAPLATAVEDEFATRLDAMLPSVRYAELTDWRTGTARETGSRFDVALGQGTFFRVQDEKGNTFYTRDGQLQLDVQGRLTTRNGLRYLDQNGSPILVANGETLPSDLSIAPNGQVSDPKTGQTWGPIGIFRLPDETRLAPVGNNLFRDPQNQQPVLAPDGLQQGYRESSNVDSLQELVQMIVVQRSFAATQRALAGVGRLHDRVIDNLNR